MSGGVLLLSLCVGTIISSPLAEGKKVSHAHLRYLRPFPRKLDEILTKFDKIVIPEINNGQLSKIIRDKFLIDVIQYNKIQGIPITNAELGDFLREVLDK